MANRRAASKAKAAIKSKIIGSVASAKNRRRQWRGVMASWRSRFRAAWWHQSAAAASAAWRRMAKAAWRHVKKLAA
jgi:hypothetical protein